MARLLTRFAIWTILAAARFAPDRDAAALRAHVPLLRYFLVPAGEARAAAMRGKC